MRERLRLVDGHPMSLQRSFLTVAVVGATGAVGETMLKILAERSFPIGQLHVLASERSAGTQRPQTIEFVTPDGVVQFRDVVRGYVTLMERGEPGADPARGGIEHQQHRDFAEGTHAVIDLRQ